MELCKIYLLLTGVYCQLIDVSTIISFSKPRGIIVTSENLLVAAEDHHIDVFTFPYSTSPTFLFPVGQTSSGNNNGLLSDGQISFNKPNGLAISPFGVVIADSSNHKIRLLTRTEVSTIAGSGAPGSLDSSLALSKFIRPLDVAVDGSGIIYVADTGNNLIRVVNSTKVSTRAGNISLPGSYINGMGSDARFNEPSGIAVDGIGFNTADTKRRSHHAILLHIRQ